MFVKLRKKLWLPMKFHMKRKEVRAEMGFRTKEEVMDRLEEVTKTRLKWQRINNKLEIQKSVGAEETLKWLLCQKEAQ